MSTIAQFEKNRPPAALSQLDQLKQFTKVVADNRKSNADALKLEQFIAARL